MTNYAEKKPDYAEISKINKVVPLAFSNVFIHDMFDLLLPFLDTYFFVQRSFPIAFFPKLSNKALNWTRKPEVQRLEPRPITRRCM